jgi:hypothetical protein
MFDCLEPAQILVTVMTKCHRPEADKMRLTFWRQHLLGNFIMKFFG